MMNHNLIGDLSIGDVLLGLFVVFYTLALIWAFRYIGLRRM